MLEESKPKKVLLLLGGTSLLLGKSYKVGGAFPSIFKSSHVKKLLAGEACVVSLFTTSNMTLYSYLSR